MSCLSICYIKDTKRTTAHKGLTPENNYLVTVLARQSLRAVFIFADLSYLCRSAMQSRIFQKSTSTILRPIYPFAPPPLFCEVREATTLYTVVLLAVYQIIFFCSISKYHSSLFCIVLHKFGYQVLPIHLRHPYRTFFVSSL